MAAHRRVALSLVSTLGWPAEQGIDLAASLGVETISFTLRQLGDAAAVRDRVAAAGLRTLSVCGGGDALIADSETTRDALAPLIDATAALSAALAFCVSGPAPARMPTDAAFDRFVTCLGPAVAYAKARGVALCIEHNSIATRTTGFVHTFADAAELARRADVGIVVELQNVWYERDLPRLFRDNAERIRLVQCSDFIVGEEVRLNRRVPGDGEIPLEWLIGSLLEAGYGGLFELELIGPAIAAEGIASAIARGIDWLSECLVRLGA